MSLPVGLAFSWAIACAARVVGRAGQNAEGSEKSLQVVDYVRAAFLATLFSQAACTHSSSEAVTDLAADLKASSFVSTIKIKEIPADAPASFESSLSLALQSAMASCATGTHGLTLDVTVTKFKAQNVAMTLLVGSSNQIQGAAQLVQPGTGAMVGDYDIETSTGGGGTIAAIAMADAEHDMTRAFASDICKKAFGRSANFSAPVGAVPAVVYAAPPVSYPQPANSSGAPTAPIPDSTQPWHEAPSQ